MTKLRDTLSAFIKLHKGLSFFLALVLGGVLYFGTSYFRGADTSLRYTLAKVEKGTMITAISGSGQVAASSQVDMKPRASGTITAIPVKEGDSVKAGTTLLQIDPRTAVKSLHDAEINLKSAQIALQKLQKPADALAFIQAENSYKQAQRDLDTLKKPPTAYELLQAQNALSQAQRDLEQAQSNKSQQTLDVAQSQLTTTDNAFNAVSNSFLDVPNIIKDLQSVQTADTDPKDNMQSYRLILGDRSVFIINFQDSYTKAYDLYNSTFDLFKSIPRTADQSKLYSLIDTTLLMAKAVSQNLEDARNMLDTMVTKGYKDYFIAPIIDKLRPLIQSDITKINQHISSLQNAKDSLDTLQQDTPINEKKLQDAVTSAEENVRSKEEYLKDLTDGSSAEDLATAQERVKETKASLEKLQAGTDELDLTNQRLTVEQREQALEDARQTLSDYNVQAPFDGIVANIAVSKGDTVSTGTIVITIISQQLLAEISFNEVDAASVAVGNKTTLTFDALPDLTISGVLVQLDTLGTVSQGVATYTAKIAFDTQDARVKSGMSVSASVITNVKTDVLLVPNSAIKIQDDLHSVEFFDPSLLPDLNQTDIFVTKISPQSKIVEVGSSNDTQTEIISGVQEGEAVITQSQSAAAAAKSAAQGATGGLRIPGLGGGTPRAGTATTGR